MKKKDAKQGQNNSRSQLEQAALLLCRAQAPRHTRIEALGMLLSAYALGSRTAARGLEEYQRRFPGWRLPGREKAMGLAGEAFREAEALKASYKDGDTLPGF